MGGRLTSSKGQSKGKRTDIVVENIIHGNDHVIVDNRQSVPVGTCISDGPQLKKTTTIQANNIVSGKRNRIVQGRGGETVCYKTNPLESNGQSNRETNFVKTVDDKDYIRNRRIITKASHSVGIIRGPAGGGTGFRVGESYVMTARHVIIDNIKVFGEVDFTRIGQKDLYIEFEYIKHHQKQNPKLIFNFKDLVYENEELDAAILQLHIEPGQEIPPPIMLFGEPYDDRPIYLIGHPNGEPLMDDPKIELYRYDSEEVQNSIKWVSNVSEDYSSDYDGIQNAKKILFHCASQHGASGALGVMVTPFYEDPVGVLMLLKGFPGCFYSRNQSFSDEDKKNFLIVEQGVLLKSIEKDLMENKNRPSMPKLKNEIFKIVQPCQD